MSSSKKEQKQQSREDLEKHNTSIVGMPPPATQAPKSRSKSSKKGSGSGSGGSQAAEVKAPASVDKHLLTSLREMGFQERQAAEALQKHHNSFEEALTELSQIAAKEAANQKGSQPAKGASAPRDKAADADRAVARLIDMGFSPALAQEAVVLKGSFDSSLEYLLVHQEANPTTSSKRQGSLDFFSSLSCLRSLH